METFNSMSKEEKIKEQVKKLDGVSKFLSLREIKELPNILWEDESVENLAQGIYSNGNGLLVATNKRILFVNKGLIWGLTVEDFSYDKISSIEYNTGLIFGKIIIYTSGNKATIDQIEKKKAREFADFARARMTATTVHASLPVQNNNLDVASQLEKLAALKEKGLLTPEEFDQQKKKLLS